MEAILCVTVNITNVIVKKINVRNKKNANVVNVIVKKLITGQILAVMNMKDLISVNVKKLISVQTVVVINRDLNSNCTIVSSTPILG